MKISSVFLLVGFILSLAAITLGEGSWRTFTTEDGRSLDARILVYNPIKGKIQIERSDGKKIWVEPAVFCEADQDYVRNWLRVEQFSSSAKFKIDGDSDKGKKITSRASGTETKQDKIPVTYTISLENKTDYTLTNLRIEYRAYIEIRGYEGRRNSLRVDGGSLDLSPIPSGAKIMKELDPFELYTHYVRVREYSSVTGSYASYDKKSTQDQLKGFWLRVHGPRIDGKASVREWCYPSDTMEDFSWRDVTSR